MAQLTIQQAFESAVQHHQGGRLREAEQLYRQILSQQPQHCDALHNLGVIAYQAGRNDIAVDLIRRALAIRPDYAEAYNNLGNALMKRSGGTDETVAAYDRAIALRPRYAEAHNNLGSALKVRGQLDEAIAAYRQSIAIRPDDAETHGNLGITLAANGQLNEAIAAYQKSIALRPTSADVYNNLGVALTDSGQLNEAIAAYRRSIALKPTFAEAYNNLGMTLKDNGQLDEAIAADRQSVLLKSNNPEAHINLGNALREKGLFDEAITAYRKTIVLRPNYAEAHLNLAFALLTKGDFQQGWDENEWRLKCKDSPLSRRNILQPLWEGRPLGARTVLLHAEQGFGDALQFIRYLPLVAERGGSIVIECQSELQRLLRTSAGTHSIVARGEPLPAFDVHCPLLSLPHIFRTTLQSIPSEVPYLFPYPDLLQSWGERLNATTGGFKVAIAWAGNPTLRGDRTRSISLDRLAPLAHVPGVTFYSIQKGDVASQADKPPAGMQLIDLSRNLHDFADTAAVMSLMDLVITTDTSVAHLAGGLGRPVWVMLQFIPDWRWLLEGEDSPWYPTMRLFRQRSHGDWQGVVGRVAAELCDLILLKTCEERRE